MDAEGRSQALASWAAVLADPTRAAFCLALLDGRAWTVSELARDADVAVSTASEHADRLVGSGLLVQHRQGRHRYLQLADADVAFLIESLTAVAGHRPAPVASLATESRRRALAHARTCYDHLAGRVAVSVADAMTCKGMLTWDHGLALTSDGVAWLAELGIIVANHSKSRRPVLRSCLDWTERRPHLAGTVGAALCNHALAAEWITRVGTGRAVKVTQVGYAALSRHLGIGPLELQRG